MARTRPGGGHGPILGAAFLQHHRSDAAPAPADGKSKTRLEPREAGGSPQAWIGGWQLWMAHWRAEPGRKRGSGGGRSATGPGRDVRYTIV